MFSIKESIRFGWEKVKANFWKIVALALISATTSLLSEILSKVAEDISSDGISFILSLASLVLGIINMIIGIGLLNIFLRMHDGENPRIKEVFSTYGVFWKYLGVSLLYGLIVAGGIILFVVPGIVWAIKYGFAPIIIVDTKSGIKSALKEGGRITDGNKWKLLGFGLVSVLIVIAGYAALFIGSLVAIPVSMFAWIHVYRTLTQAKAGASDKLPTSPQIV